MQTLHVLAMVAGAPSLYIVWHTDLHIHVGYSVSPSPNDADIYPHFLFFHIIFFFVTAKRQLRDKTIKDTKVLKQNCIPVIVLMIVRQHFWKEG